VRRLVPRSNQDEGIALPALNGDNSWDFSWPAFCTIQLVYACRSLVIACKRSFFQKICGNRKAVRSTESLQIHQEIVNHMNKLKYILTVGAIIACISPLMAQQKRISPHETISKAIDGNRIMIVYGRPYTKDPKTGQTRKIWGELVPYGEVWRTGADEATLLITQKPIVMGETTIPAGAYTLRTLPNEDGTAKLIINKQIGQWGIGPGSYDKDQDLARIDLKKEALDAPVDQFTMAISENPSGGGILKMMWENTAFSTPFTVQK